MSRWFARPGCLQVSLALAALAYLASLWLFPQWNPAYGLVLVLGLAALSGWYTFSLSLRDGQPALGAAQPAARLPLGPGPAPAAPVDVPRDPPASTPEPEPEERRCWPEPIAALRTARRAARRLGDRQAEAACLLELGDLFRHAAQPRRACFYYEQCLRLARLLGDRRSEAAALDDVGLVYADLGEPRQSADCYEQHLRLVREFGDQPAEARACWNLGLAYEELGDLPKAVAAMQVCVDFERQSGHPDAEPDAAHLEQLRARLAT